MADIWTVLKAAEFSDPIIVTGLTNVNDLFGNKRKRCGIYVLHFANKQHYVGQTTDVTRRFPQHCVRHTDIEQISFKPLARKYLNDEERRIVRLLERIPVPLRNINIVGFTYGETDFKTIMSVEQQLEWIQDSAIRVPGERRPAANEEHQRELYVSAYQALMTRSLVHEVIEVARDYVHACIPAYRRSQMGFWSCTAKPAGPIYLRINAGWQTVFDAGVSDDEPWYRFYLTEDQAASALGAGYFRAVVSSLMWSRLKGRTQIRWSTLKAGGDNQVLVEVESSKRASEYLRDTKFIQQVRSFNMGLVQKSPCMWSRNHCPALADLLVAPA